MKILAILFILCVNAVSLNAQNTNSEVIKGSWQYKSPRGKTKLTYKFDLENKFTSTVEHNETETLTLGTYEFDKIAGMDRLILSSTNKEDGTRTDMVYHLIKFTAPDTIKLQKVNPKQNTWLKETKKNTMVFVRKTEKPK